MRTCCSSSPGPHRCSESSAEHLEESLTEEEACYLDAPLSQSNTQSLTRPRGRRKQGGEEGRRNEGREEGGVEEELWRKYIDFDGPESLLETETHTQGGGGVVVVVEYKTRLPT